MAFRESNRQIHSCRTELLYQANQLKENSSRRRVWLHADLEIRERALQGTRIRTLQEMEELQNICSTEGERTQRLKMDKLFRQELQESQSSVNQRTVQIQELQGTMGDKMTTNWSFSFSPRIPPKNNRDPANDSRIMVKRP